MRDLAIRLEAATAIAREAGEVLVSYRAANKMAARDKGARDVVTEADYASERLIALRLESSFPDDAVVGEEQGDIREGDGWRWYVDPLDGTVNYSRGIPVWCVSLAVFASGDPKVGVIHDPLLSETFTGMSGSGAHLNDAPLSGSRMRSASRAIVHVTTDFDQDDMVEGLDDLVRLQARVLRTRNLGSAALGLAYVAAGRIDAMVHRRAHTWDYGAGVILVREAGGVVTAADGSPFTERSHSILAAATGELHRELLDVLRANSSTSLE